MQRFSDIRAIQHPGPTVLTIGNFDGVHLGHQALLRSVIDVAAARRPAADSALITFEPHPQRLFRPDQQLDLLTTPEERVRLASALGIDIGVIQPFTHDLAGMDARQFLTLLKSHLGMTALVVGPDFALGRDRSGTLETLDAIGQEMGYDLIVQEHIAFGDRSVRSRAIREHISRGEVREASALLGRAYHMVGAVEHGDQLGRKIGIPTANMAVPPDKLWPADGVYATRTWVLAEDAITPYPSVTNAGFRPTVNGRRRRLETHLLDFPAPGLSDNLYDSRLVVEFIEGLRGERRFGSLDDLVTQIRRDIEQAQALLPNEPAPQPPLLLESEHESPKAA